MQLLLLYITSIPFWIFHRQFTLFHQHIQTTSGLRSNIDFWISCVCETRLPSLRLLASAFSGCSAIARLWFALHDLLDGRKHQLDACEPHPESISPPAPAPASSSPFHQGGMNISLASGAARLRRQSRLQELTTSISRHTIANVASKTNVPRQRRPLTAPTETLQNRNQLSLHPTQSLGYILQLLHPVNSTRRLFAQTPSRVYRSQPLASRLGGVRPRKAAALVLATPKSTLPNLLQTFFPRRSLLEHTSAFAMSTLSQPATPAGVNSPLREHRHRPVERLTDRLETPSLDDRNYRVIRLPNQLEVLLVHDADTDKASAAMDVNVGNFSDEENLPGTAHAVEYVWFYTFFALGLTLADIFFSWERKSTP